MSRDQYKNSVVLTCLRKSIDCQSPLPHAWQRSKAHMSCWSINYVFISFIRQHLNRESNRKLKIDILATLNLFKCRSLGSGQVLYQKPRMPCYNLSNLFQQSLGVNRSGWIGWRTKNKQSWLICEFGLKNLWIQKKIFRDFCWKNHRFCISHPRHFWVTHPKWSWNYNLKN